MHDVTNTECLYHRSRFAKDHAAMLWAQYTFGAKVFVKLLVLKHMLQRPQRWLRA